MVEITRVPSTYAPATVGVGIVHIGLGAFHRAHQAVYLEDWLERHGGGDWGILAANIRSNRAIVERLAAQACRYHVVEHEDAEHARIREIGSIRRLLFAGEDKRALLDAMAAPGTRIVSLTVTEKAYYLGPTTGELLSRDPDVAQDLAAPDKPRTAPGILLAALERRRAGGLKAFTVLCCDNVPENGRRTQKAVAALAEARSAELADWIRAEVAFPSTMVDRIVPAPTEASRAKLRALIGRDDPAAVACEAFSQWVVEDRFPLGRPDWEREGVEMVGDVRPYETMKLRLLNGSHSLLAYLGQRHGTVAEAIADPALNRAAQAYLAEAAGSLDKTAGFDPAVYSEALLKRFANDALAHRLSQIAADGSQKLPQRWLEGALVNLERGHSISATAEAVAAWMVYVRGFDDDGRTYTVDDPMAERLARCHRRERAPEDVVDSLLSIGEIFPERLALHADFRDAVRAAFARLTGSA
jgi:fructuronate reductase